VVHDADSAEGALQALSLEMQCRRRTLQGRASNLLLDVTVKFTLHSLVAVVGQRFPIIVAVGLTEPLIPTNPVR
jgi:hypothetical protein